MPRALHTVVHAGDTEIHLTGNVGIAVHPCAAKHRRTLTLPEITGDIARGAHDDLRLFDLGNADDQVGVKVTDGDGRENDEIHRARGRASSCCYKYARLVRVS